MSCFAVLEVSSGAMYDFFFKVTPEKSIEQGVIIDVPWFHNQINAVSRAHTMDN